MKVFLIAGEASGDLHGSNLIKSMKEQHPAVTFECWGGDLMEKAGAKVNKHYRELAFMGFLEVILNLRTILSNIKLVKEQIEAFQPDAVVLIDYPGFNLRIAEWLFEKDIKSLYYISPQVWAWKKKRAFKIKKFVTKMFVILPFEKEFYQKYDYEVEFVGHPLLDAIDLNDHSTAPLLDINNRVIDGDVIAVVPGSRKQEVTKMLNIMLKMKQHFPQYEFVIAGAPSLDLEFYQSIASNFDCRIVFAQTYELFKRAKAGMVTSGTATLEAALHDMPEVVCYKGSAFSYWIARMLVDIKYISLVNLIADKEVVKELIQGELTETNLKHQLELLLNEGEDRNKMLSEFVDLKEKLGGSGASERTAKGMLKIIQESK